LVFSSLSFVGLFLPLVLVLHFAHRNAHWRNAVLLFASLLFYAWGELRFLPLLLLSIFMNLGFGVAIDDARDKRRPRVLAVAIAANLLLLVIFKYLNFIVDNANLVLSLAGAEPIEMRQIKLPIGISFYTFHALSYLIDVYRRNVPAQRNFSQFSLYICLFPQLVAGPIIRYKDIRDQLAQRLTTLEDFGAGAIRFVIGLAKKLLIANPLGAVADTAFGVSAGDIDQLDAWLGVLCYSLQIYFDFSGYSDMAIGLARMFGFRFPENFAYPYSARSIQEFWRRWHISLSTWFRDYVYIPLGGNRGGQAHTLRNLWIVFLLTGAWHGASWNFIVWGAIHGFFLMMERWRPTARLLQVMPQALQHLYAMLVVMIAWVFFRAESLPDAIRYLGVMSGLGDTSAVSMSVRAQFGNLWPLIIFGAILSFPVYPFLLRQCRAVWLELEAMALDGVLRAALLSGALVICAAIMAVDQYNPFIYFRF
jgi:alginate O-acetyltransferase complex protein AlgI